MITKTELLEVLNSSCDEAMKTLKLNQLGSKKVDITIEGWTLQDWRPRDEFFIISYALKGDDGILRLSFGPEQLNRTKISEIIDELAEKEGLPLRIGGMSESGGHAISSIFFVNTHSYEFV